MISWLRRPRSVRGARLALIACLVVPGVIAGIGDLFAWPTWLSLLGVPVAAVVASQLLWTQQVWRAASLKVKAAAVAALLACGLWAIAMTQAPLLTLLDVRGESVVATVVDEDVTDVPTRSGGYTQHCYGLQRGDGTPISGRICRDSGQFSVGDTITVLVDPNDLFAPETPDDVAGAGFWQVFAVVSLMATLALSWVSAAVTLAGRNTQENVRRAANQLRASQPVPERPPVNRTRPRRRKK